MSLKRTWGLIKETFSEWSNDKVPRLSAALAYYTIFSIAPILVIAIAIAGLVFGQQAAQGQIQEQIRGIIGQNGAQAIQEMIASSRNRSSGFVATVIGVAVLLFGATGLFAELNDSLNTIWEVEPKSGGGIFQTIRERFLSFTMVLGIGFLLLVSLVLSAALSAFGKYFTGLFPGMFLVAHILNLAISFAVITLLFAMIYKILPEVEIAWRDVWIGAISTAALFVVGKFLIGLYIGKSSVSSSYGAAGAIVIILVWVYYASQILFLGAEFTQVYARNFGSRIVPSRHAVPLSDQSKTEQGIVDEAGPGERKQRPKRERAPWQPEEKPAIGAISSLLVGLVLGFYYAMRGKKRTL